ncbi:hypothetical protein AB0A74_06915 [Saccharothrix sp. NPDC042600]|uniref:hypothetical protein n=1 Tax=Saccharothrix TaxID=2071 RepID=UPI0033C5B857|nr:hypothetical protein GCM10017745_30960 [Saccharothrix mutabilis subsp. capreolus]
MVITDATDPRTVLAPEELAAVRANVERAPRLAPAQLDLVAAVFRPYVRDATASRPAA